GSRNAPRSTNRGTPCSLRCGARTRASSRQAFVRFIVARLRTRAVAGEDDRGRRGYRVSMKNDSRDIALTGANDRALARYDAAVEQFQAYVGDPIATIDEALGEAPSFVAAHLFKAIVFCTLAERRYTAMARESLGDVRA